MTDQCKDLGQRCREVREEVFRHLAAFTAIEVGAAQTFLPTAIAIAGGWAAVVTTVLASEVSFDGWAVSLSKRGYLALAIAAAVLLASTLSAEYLYRRERGKATRVAGEARVVHLEDIERYIGMLEVCCGELQRSSCISEELLYCGDLNRLQHVKCKVQELLEECGAGLKKEAPAEIPVSTPRTDLTT